MKKIKISTITKNDEKMSVFKKHTLKRVFMINKTKIPYVKKNSSASYFAH